MCTAGQDRLKSWPRTLLSLYWMAAFECQFKSMQDKEETRELELVSEEHERSAVSKKETKQDVHLFN